MAFSSFPSSSEICVICGQILPLPCTHAVCVRGIPGGCSRQPMKLSRSSWKLPAACAVAIVAVLRFGAPTIIPAPSPVTAAPDPAAEVAKLKTADELFAYVNSHATVEDIQPDDSLPREEQIAQVRKLVDAKIAALRPAIDTFLKDYPKDPRHYEVALQRIFFLKDVENVSDEESNKMLHEVAEAADATPNARHRARGVLLQNDLEEVDPVKGLTPALEKELSDYEKDFPDDESGKDLVTLRVRLLQATAPDKLAATLESVAKSPNKSSADAARDQLALLTQPLDLKFDSATDGQPVDFAKLRGKVVLLDFWATWCGPCMQKLPEIQKINDKYKDKGLQLIGISLDQDKAALLKITKSKKMDWPEYFDGMGWESAVGTRFGVQSIAAAWLVDKQGLVHQVGEEADLDMEIAKLIDAKP